MCFLQVSDYVSQDMITIQSSINQIDWQKGGKHGGGGPIWPSTEHENHLHFDNEEDIHMSSKKHEESGYGPRFGFANHLVRTVCLMS